MEFQNLYMIHTCRSKLTVIYLLPNVGWFNYCCTLFLLLLWSSILYNCLYPTGKFHIMFSFYCFKDYEADHQALYCWQKLIIPQNAVKRVIWVNQPWLKNFESSVSFFMGDVLSHHFAFITYNQFCLWDNSCLCQCISCSSDLHEQFTGLFPKAFSKHPYFLWDKIHPPKHLCIYIIYSGFNLYTSSLMTH